MLQRLDVKVRGLVQGVFFRYAAKEKARQLGIKGWVKNLPDSSVQISAEGESEDLKKFLDWCRKGPSGARVEKVEYEFNNNFEGFDDFEIVC